MSLELVGISSGDKFSTLRKFPTWCIDHLIPQSHELNEIFSDSEILDEAKTSVVVSLEHFKLNIQVVGVIFGPRKISRSVLKFSKIHIIGTG